MESSDVLTLIYKLDGRNHEHDKGHTEEGLRTEDTSKGTNPKDKPDNVDRSSEGESEAEAETEMKRRAEREQRAGKGKKVDQNKENDVEMKGKTPNIQTALCVHQPHLR